ncbi:class I SAM-dependent methyltransferase [Dactylosporangium sp. AC04546]|uniref:class I SAM-dependent methyltransferase n=1 Tax=Dactylosporangium sp. AC04546 TaxID=2862460 RepID=UPI001EDCCC4B|nr:class I SAM-dependent methyltransferase [Dactylosporangium sp. AC04546]WVK89307.1 class I SAM-dependent methyltransferase [Dactylosporangium sp. AC04546]
MSDDVVAEQVRYYRRRAGEYDATAYGDVGAARERIARLVARMRPAGRVLEIACGTGLWTEALAAHAESLLAIDAAPETIAIARERAPGAAFEVADVFAWTTAEQFDVVFFSAWLSHVPDSRFPAFWAQLRGLLTDGGRVWFLDEHVDEQAKEAWVGDQIVERTLQDGGTFRIVKQFIDPATLVGRLRGLGWDCRIERDGTDWILGEARPVAGR